MSSSRAPAEWRLPPGVTRGVWDYAHSDAAIETQESTAAQPGGRPFDEELVRRVFPPERHGGAWVADLGCGVGRVSLPLARDGLRCVAVDLSQYLLTELRARGGEDVRGRVFPLRANLVELDGLADGAFDAVLCLFSTLGMIRGREQRRRALAHVRRILKPGGVGVIHVHNFWFNLFDPGGPWWLLGSLLRGWVSREWERGDKVFDYRGSPQMFLHVFTRREFVGDLRRAGLAVRELF